MLDIKEMESRFKILGMEIKKYKTQLEIPKDILKEYRDLSYKIDCYNEQDQYSRYELTEGISLERLTEICKAEKENRLNVLPCKVGDMVYFDTYINNARTSIGIKPHKVNGIKVIYCADGADIPDWEIGKSVFLTQEAGQSLKEKKNDG